MIPDGGPDGKGGCGETDTINVAVRARKVAFAFGARDFTSDCVDAQLLILPCIGLAVVGAGRPIGKDLRTDGLKIQPAFPYGAKEAFPVSLV